MVSETVLRVLGNIVFWVCSNILYSELQLVHNLRQDQFFLQLPLGKFLLTITYRPYPVSTVHQYYHFEKHENRLSRKKTKKIGSNNFSFIN